MGPGAALGALVGLLGPILLGLLGWAANSVSPGTSSGEAVISLVLVAILSIPVLLLVGGCIRMVPDSLRGWGVAALVASGVWLISSAGVCTAILFGALASYDNAAVLPL